MQIIPVIDLKNGKAVHAIAGDRANYKPVHLSGQPEGDMFAISFQFARRNPKAVYLADLDAIDGKRPQIERWFFIAECASSPLWIDCGVRNGASLKTFLDFQQYARSKHHLVIGSETLDGYSHLKSITSQLNPGNIILSLDRRDGQPLSHRVDMCEESLLMEAQALGITRVVALDLAGVGTGRAAELLDTWSGIKSRFPNLEWTLGGGIATKADLDLAEQAGFHSVLSATAILNGTL